MRQVCQNLLISLIMISLAVACQSAVGATLPLLEAASSPPAAAVSAAAPVEITSKTPAAAEARSAGNDLAVPETTPGPTSTLAGLLDPPTGAVFTPNLPPAAAPGSLRPACLAAANGRVVHSQLNSSLLDKPLVYRVYLPPCYAEQTESYYPVLYLFHGQYADDTQWDRLGVDEVASRLIISGVVPAFIIVMPFDRGITNGPSLDLFGKAVAEQLVPLIDGQYRTIPDRSFRAVGGMSRGAGWAAHLGFSYWQLFSVIGLNSPAIFWDDSPYIPGWLDTIPPDSMPRIYIDLADHDPPDIAESAYWLEDLLTRRNIVHEWYLFPGYHDEAHWRTHTDIYLRWYASNW